MNTFATATNDVISNKMCFRQKQGNDKIVFSWFYLSKQLQPAALLPENSNETFVYKGNTLVV